MANSGSMTRNAATAETLRDNQARIEELETIVAHLQEMLENRSVSSTLRRESSDDPSQLDPNLDVPDAKVRHPDEFTGKSADYASFMAQCSLVFAARPRMYAKDEHKVLFVISQLRGTPLS